MTAFPLTVGVLLIAVLLLRPVRAQLAAVRGLGGPLAARPLLAGPVAGVESGAEVEVVGTRWTNREVCNRAMTTTNAADRR